MEVKASRKREQENFDNERSPKRIKTSETKDDSEILYDETWSRLIYTIGKDALKKLQESKILLIGIKGLGIEIAKNLVLMGVSSLTIQDFGNVELSDLSSHFFVTEDSIGKNRAEASIEKLRELNDRVNIQISNEALDHNSIKNYTVVCITEFKSQSELIQLNELCRANNVSFIVASTPGLFSFVFCDFGESHTVVDVTGEPPKTAYVESITKDVNSLVTVTDNERHDLEDGDIVMFTEVEGMTELNGKSFKIEVKGPYEFSIGDTSKFSDYIKGGFIQQVKQPKTFHFDPISKFFPNVPDYDKFLIADYGKIDRISTYHAFIQAYLHFKEKNSHFTAWSRKEADEMLNFAKGLNYKDLNESLFKKLCYTAAGNLSPMAAFIGGLVAQEIIKASSSKYAPINQWFYFDSLECLAEELTEEETKPVNSRYDGQTAVFGRSFHQKLQDARYFLVGSGAIGCEVLKNWAMMGLGCGPNGHIDVSDMDSIEISNLNRQFLYRPWQVGQLKSEVAAATIKQMNPSMNIKAWSTKVAEDTEDIYNDEFWNKLTGVCNALDNVEARLYVDSRCVFYRKSLLESGTSGTKGNTQVIVPFLTESYGSSNDPQPKETPLCLLHSFPNNIEHCLQWSREKLFEGFFSKDPEIVNNYLSNPDYLKTVPETMKSSILEVLENNLLNAEKTFDECIHWARIQFTKNFDHAARQLLFSLPLDHVDKDGIPFWSGSKRPPKPIEFDPDNPLHLEFIVSATYLRAYSLGIVDSELKPSDIEEKTQYIKEYASKIEPPAFVPNEGIKFSVDVRSDVVYEDDGQNGKSDEILKKLPPPQSTEWRMRPVTFEKDDERNFHIDFIAAAANLRATSYSIPVVDRLKAKQIAGKIIPAIVTTTACVAGLVCLELYKLLQGLKELTSYKNTFLNLAFPLFQQSDPIAPQKTLFQGKEYSLWDRIEVKKGDITLQELFDYLKSEYSINVEIVSAGSSLIYAQWAPTGKARLQKKVKNLVEEITKQSLEGKNYISLEISGSDDDMNDLSNIPSVLFHLN